MGDDAELLEVAETVRTALELVVDKCAGDEEATAAWTPAIRSMEDYIFKMCMPLMCRPGQVVLPPVSVQLPNGRFVTLARVD